MVKQNIIANFIGKAWTALMSLAFIPLYIKFLGIESYGLIGIFTSLLAVFGLLDMGLSTTLTRELARLSVAADNTRDMRNLVRTLEVIYWGVAMFIAVCLIGLASPIARYWVKTDQLPMATVRQATMLMGGIVAFQWPLRLYSGGLMGMQRQVLVNLLEVGTATLRGIGAVLILWLVSPTIQAFFIWQIVISLLQTTSTAIFLWRSLPQTGDAAHFQKQSFICVWRFAAGMTGISVTALCLTQTDKILLSKLLTLEMFGYYTLATVVAGTLYRFIGPVFTAVFPRFSQLISLQDEIRLKELYHKSCQLMSVMILPPAVVVALFAPEILLLWTGSPLTVTNTHTLVSLLMIGTALNGLMNLPYALQLSYGWTKLPFYTNVIATIVLVPLIFVFVNLYGAVGAAMAWILLNSGYVFIMIQIMHRRLLQGEQWRWYLNDVGKPLFVALAVALCWRIILPTEISKIPMLIALTGVSLTTLAAAVAATPSTRDWLLHTLMKFKVTYGKASIAGK
jgi:O-antigen/teichoic acid export membrane protein